MADLAASRPTDVTGDRTGLPPRAGDMLTQFRAVSEQPAFRRALPTIVAVIVTLIGMAAYFLDATAVSHDLICLSAGNRKSRVLDALKNAGVDVVLDPTTGDVMVLLLIIILRGLCWPLRACRQLCPQVMKIWTPFRWAPAVRLNRCA